MLNIKYYNRLRLPAATDEDLDRLCCQYTLTIRGSR